VRQQEVAYLGRMTAGLTHEMKNVLATIKESAGLMSDLLPIHVDKPEVLKERFERILPSILEQVRRGVEISNRMSRLAHSMDHSPADVDVHDLLDEVVFLMSRFARLKQVVLTLFPEAARWSVSTDPLRLQLVMAAAVDHCLEGAQAGQRIAIVPASGQSRVLFQVLDADQGSPATEYRVGARPEGLSGLAEVLEELGADVGVLEFGGAVGLAVQLPK